MGKKALLTCVILIAVSLGLTRCKSSDYNEALKLEEDKEYSSVAMIYEELGEYKDSREHLENCNTMIDAIEEYNEARGEIEEKNNELEIAISAAEILILEKKVALDDTLVPALETAISEAKAAKKTVPAMPETENEIYTLIDELNAVEYKDVLSNLSDKQMSYEKSIKPYALVDAPTESYIIECLKKIPNVIDISAVAEENDPNGHLNKAGGYTAQVYFSSDLV